LFLKLFRIFRGKD